MKITTILHFNEDGDCGIMPVYKTEGAACADVALPHDVAICPGERVKVNLQIAFDIPKGWQIKMYPRSSLLIKYGLIQPTSIIDSDYHGDVHVPMYNPTNETIILRKGDRVAQIEPQKVYDCKSWEHQYEERNQQGFGGTGR